MFKEITLAGLLLVSPLYSSNAHGQTKQLEMCLNQESQVLIDNLRRAINQGANPDLIRRYAGYVEMDALRYGVSNPKCGAEEIDYLLDILNDVSFPQKDKFYSDAKRSRNILLDIE